MVARPWESEWEFVKDLGKGGQGQTKKVRLKSDPTKHAVVKELNKPEWMQARLRMRRETMNLETFKKAGGKVPAVLAGNLEDYDKDGTPLFFVMEFVEGPTLKTYVEERGGLPIDEAIAFVLDLCETMKLAHQNDLVHRDLKPANTIVRDATKNDLVIIDYGLSFNHRNEDGTVTQVGEHFWNELLALPETNTEGVDNRNKCSDVTLLCAMLYYCLTNRLLGQLQDGQGQLAHRRKDGSIRDKLGTDPRCTQIELMLDRGLAVEMQNRFQSCDELTQRLTAIRNGKRGPARDPVAAVTKSVDFLRKHDPQTQKETFGMFANHILQQISAYVDNSRQKFGENFQLVFTSESHNDFPESLTLIAGPRVVIVKLTPHRLNFSIHYAIACKGNQCVFMRKTKTSRDGDQVSKTNRTNWAEVHWYDPIGATDTDTYMGIFMDDLSEAIEELTQKVKQ